MIGGPKPKIQTSKTCSLCSGPDNARSVSSKEVHFVLEDLKFYAIQ